MEEDEEELRLLCIPEIRSISRRRQSNKVADKKKQTFSRSTLLLINSCVQFMKPRWISKAGITIEKLTRIVPENSPLHTKHSNGWNTVKPLFFGKDPFHVNADSLALSQVHLRNFKETRRTSSLYHTVQHVIMFCYDKTGNLPPNASTRGGSLRACGSNRIWRIAAWRRKGALLVRACACVCVRVYACVCMCMWEYSVRLQSVQVSSNGNSCDWVLVHNGLENSSKWNHTFKENNLNRMLSWKPLDGSTALVKRHWPRLGSCTAGKGLSTCNCFLKAHWAV